MPISFLFSYALKPYPGWSSDLHLVALVGDGRSRYKELGCEALGEGSCLEAKGFPPKLPLFSSLSPGLPTPFSSNKKLVVGQGRDMTPKRSF